jgi:hypothetical protein
MWSTARLIEASTVEAADFPPSSVALMMEELQSRGVDPEAREQVASQAQQKQSQLVGMNGWLLVFVAMVWLESIGLVLIALPQSISNPWGAFVYGALGCWGLATAYRLNKCKPGADRMARWWVLVTMQLFWLVYLLQSQRVAVTYGTAESHSGVNSTLASATREASSTPVPPPPPPIPNIMSASIISASVVPQEVAEDEDTANLPSRGE